MKVVPEKRFTKVGEMVASFADKPAPKIFYFGLALLTIGLPLGWHFPLMYYAVLLVSGGLALCQFALAEKEKKDHGKRR